MNTYKTPFISILFLIFFFTNLSAQDKRGYIVNIGESSPSVIINGENLLEKYKGKVIMLQFTASWCSVCIKEMPHIETEIWKKHKDNENFILIGLAKDTQKNPQKEKEIKSMIKKTGVTYPIITDFNSKIFNSFADEKAGVTRNIIIDQNGKIQFLTRLFDLNEFNQMKSKIEELLKKKD